MNANVDAALAEPEVRHMDISRASRVARWSVSSVFFLTGLGTANWAVRIPAVQGALGLSEGRLGIALLGVSAGALVAMPVAGRLVARHGSRPITWGAAMLFALALMLPPTAPTFATLVVALVALGLANGLLDVAMNAQAAAVQQRYAPPIMGGIHAFYSLGGLAGAVIGGRIASAGIGAAPHLAGVGLAVAIAACAATIGMLPAHTDAAPNRVRGIIRLRVLLPLGVLAFFVLFGEGAMMNWSAVYLRNVSRTGPGLAAAGFASFSLMMTAGRAIGDRLTSRLGASRLTRIGGAVAAAGITVALVTPQPLLVVLGFGAVGAGLSIIFPLVLAAAARTPGIVPGAAIAAVSMCGYSGLLAGPPLIGALSNAITLRGGLALVAATSVGVVLLAGAVRATHVARVGGGAETSPTDRRRAQTAA